MKKENTREATLIKADYEQFRIFKAIYTGVDTKNVYSWEQRLEENNTEKDDCYFLMFEGKRIGGVHSAEDWIGGAFLIPPFSDRALFWHLLLKLKPAKFIYESLDEDKDIVFKHGYKLTHTLKYMVRPSESIDSTLPEGFLCLPIDKDTNLEEVAMALKEGYRSGFVFDASGELKIEDVLDGLNNDLNRFSVKNSCYKIVEDGTEKIVAVCLAGIAEGSSPMFSFIHELTVLSKYRGNGLGKYLISRVINDSKDSVPFVKLAFMVGNEAELLYENLGFMSGSSISDFEQR